MIPKLIRTKPCPTSVEYAFATVIVTTFNEIQFYD